MKKRRKGHLKVLENFRKLNFVERNKKKAALKVCESTMTFKTAS
jgi:hypothetical protein